MSRILGGLLLFIEGASVGAGELNGPVAIILFVLTLIFAIGILFGAFVQHE